MFERKFVENTKQAYDQLVEYLDENCKPGSNRLSCIIPHLYISDFSTACDYNLLKKTGIKIIINLSMNGKSYKVKQKYKKHNISEIHLPIDDSMQQDLHQTISQTYQLIKRSLNMNTSVLIHCDMGISRASSITTAFLLRHFYLKNITKQNWKKTVSAFNIWTCEIIKFVHSKRACVRPNSNFIQQLLNLEYYLKTTWIQTIQAQQTDQV